MSYRKDGNSRWLLNWTASTRALNFFAYDGTDLTYANGKTTVTADGNWHLVEIAYANKALTSMKLDGVEANQTSTATSMPQLDGSFYIGAFPFPSATNFFAGKIDYFELNGVRYNLNERVGSRIIPDRSTGIVGTVNGTTGYWTPDSSVPFYDTEPNEIGYSISDGVTYYYTSAHVNLIPVGTVIPRDELNPTKCMAWDSSGVQKSLQYSGRVNYALKIGDVPVLSPDGTTNKIVSDDFLGVTVVSNEGTSVASISGNELLFTAGTCWDVLLSNGAYFPLHEGSGDTVWDVVNSVNYTVSGTVGFWGYSDDAEPRDLFDGYRLDGLVSIPATEAGGTAADGNALTHTPTNGEWNGANLTVQVQEAPLMRFIADQFSTDPFFNSSTAYDSKGIEYADIVANYESLGKLVASILATDKRNWRAL
jgi:hypothetical protein